MAAQPDRGAVPASPGVERTPGQHVPAAKDAGRPSQWDIYRFEFAFFDLDSQRWQLFQEGLGMGDGADHRAQIESLLHSLRRALAAVPRGTLFNPPPDRRTAADHTTPLTLTLEQGTWETFGDKATDHWRTFVGELQRNAEGDGLLDLPLPGASHEDKRKLRDLISELKCWPEKLSSDAASSSLPPQAACLLISLLPIPRHWDIYGAIRQAWATTRPGPSDSLWQECGKMMEPFYCCHFSYHPEENEKATLPNQLITAEAVLSDLAQPELRSVDIALRECFTYVYKPKGEELIFYRINAFFQDAIQRALAASKSQEDENEVEQDVYYFAYPIFSGLGRRHFLHVYARPERPNATVGELFEAWRQFHAQLNWPELRNVLVDELGEIDLVRLRHRVFKKIEEISKTQNKPDEQRDKLVLPLVANQLHLVFPIRCACHNGELGFYDEPTKDTVEVEAERILGFPWKELSVYSDVEDKVRCGGRMDRRTCARASIPGSDRPIVWDDRTVVKLGPVQREIVAGRQQRLIQQEIEFARMVWRAHEATRRIARQENERLWTRQKTLIAANRNALVIVLSAVNEPPNLRFQDSAMTSLLTEISAEADMTASKFFKPLFYLECNNKEDWERAGRELVTGGLHEFVSEYIETGVVRLLLHTDVVDQEFDGDGLFNDYPATLAQALSDCIPEGKVLRDLHKGFVEVLNEIRGKRVKLSALQSTYKAKLESLGELRKQFRHTIEEQHASDGTSTSPSGVLKRYLGLTNTDNVIGKVGKITIHIPQTGFGESAWEELLKKLRALTISQCLHACAYTQDGKAAKESRYHNPAKATETVFLLGGEINSGLADNLESDVPEGLTMWGAHISRWGETFAIKVEGGRISTALSLPDRRSLPVSDVAAVAHLKGQWLFCGIKVLRYKVLDSAEGIA